MSKSALNPVANLNPMSVAERLGILNSGAQYLNTYKSADQGVTNSIVVVNDAELALRLPYSPFGGAIALRMMLNLNIANAAHNIRYALVADEGLVIDATQTRGFSELKASAVASQMDTALTLNTTVNGGVATAWTQAIIEITLKVSQPGLLRLQFAQGTAGASTTSILRGSSMCATLILP